MDLIQAGMDLPDLGNADPEKFPELIAKSKELLTKDKEPPKLSEPVRDTIKKPGKWDSAKRRANGTVESGTRTSAKDTIIKGKNQDTLRHIEFTRPN